MKCYIGITDEKWFNYLREQRPDEINFWRPSSAQDFKALQPGDPFLFKLHSPKNFIVGGGFFVSYARLPLTAAWDAFGYKNGADDIETLRSDINRYRESHKKNYSSDPLIGCIILNSPFFLDDNDRIPSPKDWPRSAVQGKTYDTSQGPGAEIWQALTAISRSAKEEIEKVNNLDQTISGGKRYGSEYLSRARLGQGAFRVLITEAYKHKCAITGEGALPVLQASHIQPYSKNGPHSIDNGILLRADLHILFDCGHITITPDYKVRLSKHFVKDYEIGKEYESLNERSLLFIPNRDIDRPAKVFLDWHNHNVFEK
jgi:putative restriction endonuclease